MRYARYQWLSLCGGGRGTAAIADATNSSFTRVGSRLGACGEEERVQGNTHNYMNIARTHTHTQVDIMQTLQYILVVMDTADLAYWNATSQV